MSTLVIISTTLITLALLFYSLGVWSERIAKYLKPWHVVAFWIGFTFDVSGTYAMHLIAKGPFNIIRASYINRTNSFVAYAAARNMGNKSYYKTR